MNCCRGTRLFNTYASTETGVACTYNFNDGATKPGCCGASLMNSEVFITDDGHIACKGKTLMSGYLDEPALTASVMSDGCVYTADNGFFDEDEMLHITGRSVTNL